MRKSLYYYFMMGEVTEAGADAWRFIARKFGVDEEDISRYGALLENGTLKDISSCNDVMTYKNYLASGYCRNEEEFGKRSEEMLVIDCKFKALERIAELFNGGVTRGNRLGSLAHRYEQHHTAAVLYSLCMLNINGDGHAEIAKEILYKELTEGKNSTAGILLLNIGGSNEAEIMS